MELKRATKKLLSDSNLRLLSNLIISLSNTTTSVQERCVEPYEDGKVYQAGVSLVLKDSELYFCKVTNQDATWNPLHWELIGKDINEIDLDTVKSWLNLSQEELDNLQKLLKDDQITTTSTFSSSKIYSDLQAAIDTAKEYTNNQLGKAVKPAYKVVASTSEVTETGYFYLISNGANYDMYVLSADGSVVSLGTSDVDLSDYAKLTDLDNYYDKNTSDGKFALITTVDAHINDTVAHLTQDERDKLVTTDDLGEYAKTTDIPSDDKIKGIKSKLDFHCNETISIFDFIDSKVTDGFITYTMKFEEVATDTPCNYGICEIIADSPSWIKVIAYDVVSKCTYIAIKENGTWNKTWTKIVTENDLRIGTKVDQSFIGIYGNDILKYPKGRYNIQTSGLATSLTNLPNNNAGVLEISSIHEVEGNPFDTAWCHRIYKFEPFNGGLYIKTLQSNDTPGNFYIDTGWQKVCTTTVADVAKTNITFSNTTNYSAVDGSCSYFVKNGICTITLYVNCVTPSSTWVTVANVPKAHGLQYYQHLINGEGNGFIKCVVKTDGNLQFTRGAVDNSYIATFSYPVAE